jgi:hypothetical protein
VEAHDEAIDCRPRERKLGVSDPLLQVAAPASCCAAFGQFAKAKCISDDLFRSDGRCGEQFDFVDIDNDSGASISFGRNIATKSTKEESRLLFLGTRRIN